MKRRRFTSMLMTMTAGTIIAPSIIRGNANDNLPGNRITGHDRRSNIPDNLKQMITKGLKTDYRTLNTDHDGSFVIEGLLRFANRGFREALEFAGKWFDYHVEHDGKLTDEEYFKQYHGSKSRILRDGPLTFSIYSANLAVAFPVYELYKLNQDPTAKSVCFDVANAVLHYSARDRFGMLAHDDNNFTNFSIPDGIYFGIRACAIAASLAKGDLADVYLTQSIYQLDQGIKYFMDWEKGLARIGLFKGEPSNNYWCRSQGWLMWCISGLLRYMPQSHPKFKDFASTMKMLADGASAYQSKNGGFHVYVNDPSTPEEVSGMAMVLASVKEALRNGWISGNYNKLIDKGWDFIQNSVDSTGLIKNVYNGWAVPAEEGRVDIMDRGPRGFITGIMMIAIDELSR